MLHTFAVSGYRSLMDNVFCLGQLNVVTGANGSGKSSLYRALRLSLAVAGLSNLRHSPNEPTHRITLRLGDDGEPMPRARTNKPVDFQ